MKTGFAVIACMTTSIAGTSVNSNAIISKHLVPIRHETRECQLPPGWDAVAARKPHFVIFGETHGTQQAPAFVGDVACALAARGERVLVAVEHSSTENAILQNTWSLSDAQFPGALKRAGWSDRDDGTSSEAMSHLLLRLHRLAHRGQSIDIVAFNGARDEAQSRQFSHLPGQGAHEAAQADNIRIAAAAHSYDRVLVLVGNAHARKRPIERSGAAFEPMAMRLGSPSTIVTLNMLTAGGTAWNCELKRGVTPRLGLPITANDIACGSYPFRGLTDLRRPTFIELGALPGSAIDPDYDGIFWLGKVSASPPAVDASEPVSGQPSAK
ncbi:hypothetical protein [Sphingomonas oligophenolica]|uniref:hypothetical protein n=1 Tax=Sphingomonas oligophenolica TaxID=301154 RepID=UPI001128B707|nr:hypothetical protein [Sphingomonas oligophenolica]